jgi:hypothetical protein
MRAAAVSIALVTLAACGGGGGGGGGGTPSAIEVPFTSFTAVRPNQTVVMEGTAVTATGNVATAANGDDTVSNVNFSAHGPATVRLSYDGSPTPTLTHIGISTASSPSAIFDRSTHTFSCNGTSCTAENLTSAATVVDPAAGGWNYQSFGIWGADVSPTSWTFGVTSVGAATSGNSLPTTGGAVFNGIAVGAYVDSGGTLFATSAIMSANVNFSARNIEFSTFGTNLINSNTSLSTTNNGLNLLGTLSYAQGVNSFTGGVQTVNGALSGQGSGRFYGPSAQEIGGVYSLTGAGASRMIGGFGGKQ